VDFAGTDDEVDAFENLVAFDAGAQALDGENGGVIGRA
jgi:hypothetical protein